jgi:hypothetical protein
LDGQYSSLKSATAIPGSEVVFLTGMFGKIGYCRALKFVVFGDHSKDSRRDARLPKQPGRLFYFPQIMPRTKMERPQ